MGFGLLFLGYFIAYFMSLALPLKIVGCLLMIWAVMKLSEYNERFRLCIAPLGILCAISVYAVICFISKSFEISSVICADEVYKVVSNLGEVVDIAYHTCLLTAVCSIAKETELPKPAFNSMRNLLIVWVGGVLYFVAMFMPVGNAAKVVGYIATVIRLLWIVLDCALIANCYRLICPEGEEDMPVKESKIGIIRKMDAVINKREENAMQAGREFVEKRSERKKRRKNKK